MGGVAADLATTPVKDAWTVTSTFRDSEVAQSGLKSRWISQVYGHGVHSIAGVIYHAQSYQRDAALELLLTLAEHGDGERSRLPTRHLVLLAARHQGSA